MKRLLVIAGLLLLPASALAAGQPALSPWVQTILDKADKGIAVAARRPADEACRSEQDPLKKARLRQTAITEAQNVLRKGIDIRTQVSLEARSLFEQNVCFRSDVRLVEAKMQEVRQAMIDHIDSCNLVGANVLGSVYSLLSLAQKSLVTGGLDPTYRDNLARQTYFFESEELVTTPGTPVAQDDTSSAAPSCPFTSDYGPHSYATAQSLESEGTLSFGCDETVIQTLPDTLKNEWERQHAFMADMSTIAGSINAAMQAFITTMNSTVSYIRHGAPPDISDDAPIRPSDVRHGKVDGCLALDENEAGSEAARDYADDFSAAPRTDTDAILPLGLLFRPAYDYFSLFQNPLTLLQRSADTKARQGYEQALVGRTLYAGNDTGTKLLSTVAMTERDEKDLRGISANQAREQAIVNSWSADAIQRSNEAFSELDGSVKALGNVVKEKGTLPLYIRDVAYFLLRSCVDGHCTKNLDTILKRVLNPYCYPYSSDLYKEDKVPEKCFCQDEDWGGYGEYCMK